MTLTHPGTSPVPESALRLVVSAYTDPDARRLIAAALADLGQRYGGDGDSTPVTADEFSPPGGLFLVAYLDAVPVGCGGWRTHGDDAEIKRMYTVPEARGRGVAKAVLAELERTARARGRRRTVLVTGTRQPEAIALYESQGYRRIPTFGHYMCEPGAVSYARDLLSAPA